MIRRNAAVRGVGAVAGRAAAFNSDIYALGLSLFEILTGRRAADSKTLADLNDFHKTGTSRCSRPASEIWTLPLSVILRCPSVMQHVASLCDQLGGVSAASRPDPAHAATVIAGASRYRLMLSVPEMTEMGRHAACVAVCAGMRRAVEMGGPPMGSAGVCRRVAWFV
jgi:hypothetical protein